MKRDETCGRCGQPFDAHPRHIGDDWHRCAHALERARRDAVVRAETAERERDKIRQLADGVTEKWRAAHVELQRRTSATERRAEEAERVLRLCDPAGDRLAAFGLADFTPELREMCESRGYGAVMDAVARAWRAKDPQGAFTVGPCAATVCAVLAESHETGLLGRARELVAEQADDPGLWFAATNAAEAYLQRALRTLHAAIENDPMLDVLKRGLGRS